MHALLSRPKLLTALMAVAASIAGVRNDFVYDDRAMLVDVSRLQGLGHWREILTQPFWPPPFYDRLYRPVTSLLLAGEYAVGGGSPVVFRVVSIALYAVCAVLFYSLAVRLVSRNAALAASALWAAHPVHVEAVAQAVNQSELLIGIAALVMVIGYVDARQAAGAGAPSARTWGLLVLLFALSTLTKETGFILPALLVLVECVLLPGQPFRERVKLVWHGYALFGLVAWLVLMGRGLVLSGDVLAANPSAALSGADLPHRMFAMLQVVPMWLRLLVWPLRLKVDFAPSELGMPDYFGVPEAMGVVLLAATVATILLARRNLKVASFGLAWCTVALLPVANIVPVYFMLAERTLFLPSVGFLLAVAALGQLAVARTTWPPRRVVFAGACVVLCALGLTRSISRQLVWNSAHIVVRPTGAP